ncbi:hypothetical protein BB559_001153 [Furculomyces boomerangus]|uniref:Pentacotripeptide-repeat region of PRORP domain-containing protein n=1 Tax=Furculomyces boomerangus TaxID=61424 RepID=A0A2T9Z2W4_9FUNG|nr:hypothetical protein BB559_001153 [Furculomyces boomerangus]
MFRSISTKNIIFGLITNSSKTNKRSLRAIAKIREMPEIWSDKSINIQQEEKILEIKRIFSEFCGELETKKTKNLIQNYKNGNKEPIYSKRMLEWLENAKKDSIPTNQKVSPSKLKVESKTELNSGLEECKSKEKNRDSDLQHYEKTKCRNGLNRKSNRNKRWGKGLVRNSWIQLNKQIIKRADNHESNNLINISDISINDTESQFPLHPLIQNIEELLLQFPFVNRPQSSTTFDKERKQKHRSKSTMPFKVTQVSDVWAIYKQISNHPEKNLLLRQLSEPAIFILIDLVKRADKYNNIMQSHERVVEIIEDIFPVGKQLESSFFLNSYLLALNCLGRYKDTISIVLSLADHSSRDNETGGNKTGNTFDLEEGDFGYENNYEMGILNTFGSKPIGTTTMNHLIYAYLELGNFNEALSIFRIVSKYKNSEAQIRRNAFTYSMMFNTFLNDSNFPYDIDSNVADSRVRVAVGIFEEMVSDYKDSISSGIDIKSFELNHVTLNVMMDTAFKSGYLEIGSLIFQNLTELGVSINKATLTILINGMGKSYQALSETNRDTYGLRNKYADIIYKLYESVNNLLSTKKHVDSVFSTSVINILIKLGNLNLATIIYKNMCNDTFENAKPTIITYTTLLNGYTESGMVKEAVECYRDLINDNNYVPTQPIFSSMRKSFLSSSLEEAEKSIDLILEKRVVPELTPFMIAISHKGLRGDMDGVLNVYHKLQSIKDFEPDMLVFYLVFEAYYKASKATVHALKSGSPLQFITDYGLQIVLGKKNAVKNPIEHCDHPRKLFEFAVENEIELSSTVYNLMIGTLVGFGDLEGAQKVYNNMTAVNGINPTSKTYTVMLDMFLRRLDVSSAEQLLSQIFEKNENYEMKLNCYMYNGLIHAATRSGYIDLALEIYIHMVGREEFLLTDSKIYSNETGNTENINNIELRRQMFNPREIPDSHTFHYLIYSLLKQERSNEALELYEDMYSLYVLPDPSLTAMLVDGLEFNGYPDQAKKVLMERYRRLREVERYRGIE